MDLLNKAIAAHQAGDLATAETLYVECLVQQDNSAAKQLLGLLYSTQGKYEQAERLMLGSLQMSAAQPNVHNNLANCYRRQGKLELAIDHYRQAIELKPDYVDAYRNLAYTFFDRGNFQAAAAIAVKAFQIAPEDPALFNLSGLIRQEMGDYRRAIADFESALSINPEYQVARHNLGVAYRLNKQPAAALVCYQQLLDKGFSSYELLQNVGNAYADLGQLDTAVDYYRRVLDVNPGYVDAHRNLSTLLWSMGRHDEFLDSYEHAFSGGLLTQELALAYLETLLIVERPQEALTFLEGRSEIDQSDARVRDFLGRCHLATGDLVSAMGFHEGACEVAPDQSAFQVNRAIGLLVADRTGEAADILADIVAREPDNQAARAHFDLCRRILNDDGPDVRTDYDSLVGEYELTLPEGYDDIAAFNRDLDEFLTSIHTSSHHPYAQTLRGGTQTQGDLFGREEDVVQALLAGLRIAVQAYVDRLASLGKPLAGFESTRDFEFSASWSVKLKREGFHTMHIPPMGRISSVYYVDLPGEITGGDDKAGWLKFGEPNLILPHDLPADHFVKPRAGKLVLFPSYVWHGTIPFESDHPRTTVAFDVVPVNAPLTN